MSLVTVDMVKKAMIILKEITSGISEEQALVKSSREEQQVEVH